MKKKTLFSLIIISSTFAFAGGVLSANHSFNRPMTVMAEEGETETEIKTIVLNKDTLGWTGTYTKYTNKQVEGTDLVYSTISTVSVYKSTYFTWSLHDNVYGGMYNTVALPGAIASISYEMNKYTANDVYFGTASNPTTGKVSFTSSKTTGEIIPTETNCTFFKIVQTGSGYSNFKSITIKYYGPKAPSVTDFSLDKTTVDLGLLDQYVLTPTILPETADRGVTYESSDSTIASVSSAGTITGLKAGTATITATTAGKDAEGNAKTATCVVNVTGTTPTIAGLRDKAGNFKEELSNVKLTLSGIITSIDTAQKQMTIEDNGKAVLLYQMDNVTGYKVGDKVDATGTMTSYSGLVEMKDVKKSTVVTTGTAEVPTPTKLENTDAASLLGLDSIIFEATGKLKSVPPSMTSGSDLTITFVLSNGKQIPIFSKKTVNGVIGTKMLAYLKKAGTTETLTFKLPLGWYNKPQLSMLPDMSVVSSTNIDAVDKFVADFMHPEVKTTDAGTGKCISEGWYSKAKEAYLALTEEQKNMFDTNAGYKDMKARYDAWAKVNPEVTGLNIMAGVNSNNTPIIIAGSLVAFALASFGLLFLLKKKKANK